MTSRSAAPLEATRQSLLERMKNWEDHASWQEFFNIYWRLIYGVAIKAGLTDEEAQDAVQDTILAVARHIREFEVDRARCSFKNWLLLIARQRIVWQLRQRSPASAPSRHRRDDSTGTATIERVPDPAGVDLEGLWDTEWRDNLMTSALEHVKAKVSPRQFQIFDLYVLRNWPAKEVQQTLQVNLAQLYLAKHRVGLVLKQTVKRLEQSGR